MTSPISKKALQKQVAETMLQTFSGLRDGLSEKKFTRNIKRATKALLDGIKYAPAKKAKKKQAA